MSRYRHRYSRYGRDSYYPVSKSKNERISDAIKKTKALEKKGAKLSPVVLSGFTIATTVWGKAWCKNIESYQDYTNRLPRGRSYLRSGSVIDLQIERGIVRALVMGTSLYKINIAITPVSKQHWAAVCRACAGKIGSVIELLQGRISKDVMAVMTDPESGLFPKPAEIKLRCSCPDYAHLCKHLAATLYGIGSRLDVMPELLFVLRGVDTDDLIAQAVDIPERTAEVGAELADDELSDVFGIDIDITDDATKPAAPQKQPAKPTSKKRGRPKKKSATIKPKSVSATLPKRRARLSSQQTRRKTKSPTA